MTQHPDPGADACQRHAALIAATMSSIDALPPLRPDATPQSFAALKAAPMPGPTR